MITCLFERSFFESCFQILTLRDLGGQYMAEWSFTARDVPGKSTARCGMGSYSAGAYPGLPGRPMAGIQDVTNDSAFAGCRQDNSL